MEKGPKLKWRPTLGQLVFVVFISVLCLPLAGLFLFRLYENQLIRETEAELIAQSAAIASIFARDAEEYNQSNVPKLKFKPIIDSFDYKGDPKLSYRKSFSLIKSAPIKNPSQPIFASLDLTSGDMLSMRPPAYLASIPPDTGYALLGERLQSILQRTQQVTLAGFRLLDPNGIVIAGRNEVGMSLAHIEEVQTALKGQYRAVLRTRIVDEPPPLYSLSRGTKVRIFIAMPVLVGHQLAGIVYASRTPNNIIRHIYVERGKFFFTALMIIVLTIIVGHIFLRGVARPIRNLVARAEQIGRGERDNADLLHYGTREIQILAQSLTNMAHKLNKKSDYISTFAAHVSHELKSPLTSIQGAAELLKDDLEAPSPQMNEDEKKNFLNNIIKDTSRSTLILNRLRELARADNPQKIGETSLGTLFSLLKKKFPEFDIKGEGDAELKIPMAEENLDIVFSHLADNALRHGASILSILVRREKNSLIFDIKDDGSGISENNLNKIFDAFFTTRRDSGGTGMGLGIVQAMLHAHHGRITSKASENGAHFEICFSV